MRGWRNGRSRRARDADRFATPIAPPLWPPLAEPVDDSYAPADASVEAPLDPPVAAWGVPRESETEPLAAEPPPEQSPPAPAAPAAAPVVAVQLEMQAEFLRLLEVVTSMCDHVIEYIESDRAERRVMVETLTDLGRVITDGAAAVVAAAASVRMIDAPADEARSSGARAGESASSHADAGVVDLRERVIGGSMPAGPEPVIDLVARDAAWDPGPAPAAEAVPPRPSRLTATDAAVEVRGLIGDRWVDGFEICDVMSTAAGPRYRLRRRRDGVVLPELFEASGIRHVDTFDREADEAAPVSASDDPPNEDVPVDEPARETRVGDDNAAAPPHYWSRS
jgi:hypothetical protein